MISFPRSVAEAAALRGEPRAGGTDIGDRRRRGTSGGDVVDLRDVKELRGIQALDTGGLRIAAMTPVFEVGGDPRITAGWPSLALAAALLGTPQIRAGATLGGNLLQRVRCAYFRRPPEPSDPSRLSERCYQAGGGACPAREGVHDRLSCFDLGPCLAPHPSTIGLALVVHEATAEVQRTSGPTVMPVAELFGDGRDPSRSSVLRAGEILVAIRLPPPVPGERGGYVRASGRVLAEWPLVDASIRLALAPDGRIALVRVALGGVAPIPLRRELVEQALLGQRPTPALAREVASLAAEGANPLPSLRYKIQLVAGVVEAAIGQAMQWPPGGTA